MKKSILLVSLVCILSLLSNGYARNAFSANHFAEDVICNMPSGPVTTDITQTSAIFNWYAVSGAMSYSVQMRQPGGTWANLMGSPFTNTYATATNLSPGTQYEWRVQTNCMNGEYSNWTMSIFFTTLGSGGGGCYEPDILATTNITQTSATWDWNAVSGANSYSVQWRYPGGTWYNLPNGPYYNSYVNVAGLSPNTTYEWRVRSNCANGAYSPWSLPDVFTTLGSSCSTPTWPSTLSVSQTSATVDWDPVSGAQSYSVQYRLPGGTWYYAPGSPFANSTATISGLSPGTNYEWRVRANCYGGSTSNWTNPVPFTTLGSGGGSCVAPDYLATLNVTATSASFDWDPVSGAIHYSVQWRVAGGTWYYLPGGPFYGTYLNVSGFNPGTTYEWRVRSNCANGSVSEWSLPSSFTTLNISCQQPYGLATSNITETSALFSWAVISGAQSYSVQIRTLGGAWNFLPGSPFMSNSVTASNLNPGTAYEWRVRANCGGGGNSYWSPPMAFTTLGSGGGTCEPPSWLGTTNITSTTATWDWSPASGAISYSIEWRYPNGAWNNLNGGPFYNTWVNVGNLTPGTTYEWRVRSNCSNGIYSAWSYVTSFTTLGSSCNTPGGLFTSYITESAAMFNWSPVSGASSYSVQYRLPGGTWFYIPGSPFQNSPASIFNLTPGTTYEWRVRANCYGGLHSAWSSALQFTTLGSSSCIAPSWFNESNITQTSAVLEWNSVSGAVSYTVEYRISGGTWYQAPGSPFTNTWVNLMNLQPSTAYEWRVRSNCSNGGYSAWGPVQYFNTSGGSGSGIDNCDTALPLTVNGSCMNTAATNVGATPSTPPPAGNCYSNNYKDVWFTFTMPNVSNPQVTIRTTAGSLFDGVMEVYIGTTCSSMYFVACEDDNLNGNGSSMPVISLQGNAGAQVFVRFWGYGGMTGTFNICVLNYYTPNVQSYDLDDVVFEGEVFEPVENAVNQIADYENDKAQGELFVTPNPANDLMKIEFVQTPDCRVTSMALVDYAGRRILTKTYEMFDGTEFSDEIDVTDLPDGLYVLQMMTSCGLQTEKIVIAHR